VTQTLVELCGMVVLTGVVPRWLLPDAPTPIWGTQDSSVTDLKEA
jgi:hypothetical protein